MRCKRCGKEYMDNRKFCSLRCGLIYDVKEVMEWEKLRMLN